MERWLWHDPTRAAGSNPGWDTWGEWRSFVGAVGRLRLRHSAKAVERDRTLFNDIPSRTLTWNLKITCMVEKENHLNQTSIFGFYLYIYIYVGACLNPGSQWKIIIIILLMDPS